MKRIVLSSIVLGIVSGILWGLNYGFINRAIQNDILAWWILPALLPIIISLFILALNKESKIKQSIIFFITYYIAHWILVIISSLFAGGTLV